jgi:hypothetical protein
MVSVYLACAQPLCFSTLPAAYCCSNVFSTTVSCAEDGAKAAAAASDGLVLQSAAVVSGDEVSASEVTTQDTADTESGGLSPV